MNIVYKIITIPERQENVKKLCKMLDLSFDKVQQKAILKRQVLINSKLNMGELACFLSHVKVYMNNSAEYLCVLEDDVKLNIMFRHINFKLYIDDLIHELNKITVDWDILYLGRCWDLCKKNVQVSKLLTKTFLPGCTHSYIIKNASIPLVLSHILPIRKSLDRSLKFAIYHGKLKAYATTHNMFVQDRINNPSTLGHEYEVIYKCIDSRCGDA